MAHSHSSHSHHHRMQNKPSGLGQNFENLMMGSSRRFQNAATSSNNVQQEDHSWQTERTVNLDDFDDKDFNLVNYIAADSTTPLEEIGPGLDMDEIERQKLEAQYTQMNYELIFPEQQQQEFQYHQDRHDYVPTRNDFSNVPDYAEEMGQNAGIDMDYQQEEEIPPPIPQRRTSTPHANYIAQQTHQNLDKITLVPSTSRSSAVHQPLKRMLVKPEIVKEEPSEHQEEFVGLSLSGSTSSRGSSITSNPMPAIGDISGRLSSTKPRKYRIKPEAEKTQQYRAKRIKNNDAVRKSRQKARLQQEAKESRLQELEDEVQSQAQIIAEFEAQNVQLRNELGRLKQNCRCGATTGKHRR